jgi:hypothetical protein
MNIQILHKQLVLAIVKPARLSEVIRPSVFLGDAPMYALSAQRPPCVDISDRKIPNAVHRFHCFP